MSQAAATEEPGTPLGSMMLRRTVAVVDMVGYSSIARMLEENISAMSVSDLNRQIQGLFSRALGTLQDRNGYCVVSKPGDGIILLFERADDAHQFGRQVHLFSKEHNELRSERTAQRWFRVGVATGDVDATACSTLSADYAGLAIINAVRLESAARTGDILVDTATYSLFSPEVQRLYGAEETVEGKREERFRVRRFHVVDAGAGEAKRPLRPLLTRRAVLTTGTAAAIVAGLLGDYAVSFRLKSRQLPLPPKRYVVVMGWPVKSDPHLRPLLEYLVDCIGNELARAEAQDSDFFITPHRLDAGVTKSEQLVGITSSLGTNLILAVSGKAQQDGAAIFFRLFEAATLHALREIKILVTNANELTFQTESVRAVSEMLGIKAQATNLPRLQSGTGSPEAYAAFQTAESYMDQPNDRGLENALENYKKALDFDPHFAKANAQLAWAYCRYYFVRKMASALLLAEENCKAAISMDPQLVEAHLAYASVLEYRGDRDGAFRETARALAIDPSNPKTLVYQAQLYSRANRWADAETTFGTVLTLRPNYWWAHNERGVLYNYEGKYPEALNEFRAVTLMLSNNALAFNNVGSIYLQIGKPELAMSAISRSLELAPSDAAASTMAEILRVSGRYSESVEYAKRAVSLGPESSSNWLELADCYSYTPNHRSDASEAYKKALWLKQSELRVNGLDGPGLITLALLSAKCGSNDDPSALLGKAEKLPIDDMDSQLAKSRVLEVTGRRSEALSTVSRCLERGATTFQIENMPDMRNLVIDPRYKELARLRALKSDA